jgi:hypothetical protein
MRYRPSLAPGARLGAGVPLLCAVIAFRSDARLAPRASPSISRDNEHPPARIKQLNQFQTGSMADAHVQVTVFDAKT